MLLNYYYNKLLFYYLDIFGHKQLYVLFAFENSGCALESFIVRQDGWMNDRLMDGWIDGWMDVWMDVWING